MGRTPWEDGPSADSYGTDRCRASPSGLRPPPLVPVSSGSGTCDLTHTRTAASIPRLPVRERSQHSRTLNRSSLVLLEWPHGGLAGEAQQDGTFAFLHEPFPASFCLLLAPVSPRILLPTWMKHLRRSCGETVA